MSLDQKETFSQCWINRLALSHRVLLLLLLAIAPVLLNYLAVNFVSSQNEGTWIYSIKMIIGRVANVVVALHFGLAIIIIRLIISSSPKNWANIVLLMFAFATIPVVGLLGIAVNLKEFGLENHGDSRYWNIPTRPAKPAVHAEAK
jgi:hypothetical protein